jgi:ketosteroid isomerase-like protein
MEIRPMTDEQRRAIALEYVKRLDRGEDVLELFDVHALLHFPKWGLARGHEEIHRFFGDVTGTLAEITHDVVYPNVIQQGDMVVVESTTYGKTKNGVEWRAGLTHAGRWCDVFEIRDFRIHRLSIYLDPDYEGADTQRYPWLETSRQPR